MLISKKLQDTLNQQVGNEFGASLEYLQIASYFESEDMLKLSQIFFDQAEEERFHAMKLLRYVLDAGGTVAIPAILAISRPTALAVQLAKELNITLATLATDGPGLYVFCASQRLLDAN